MDATPVQQRRGLPHVEFLPHGKKRLLRRFTMGGRTAPKGFVLDGASVPSWLHWYADDDDDLFNAAIIHDFDYRIGSGCSYRDIADGRLYTNIVRTGIRRSKAFVIWMFVRAFGFFSWKKHHVNWTGGE